MTKYLVFDTETTGFLAEGKLPSHPAQPYLLQLGVATGTATRIQTKWELILNQEGVALVPPSAVKVHGIDVARMRAEGIPPLDALKRFDAAVHEADVICAFNMQYDEVVALAAFHRVGGTGGALAAARKACLMLSATELCGLPKAGKGRDWGGCKWPSLEDAYRLLVSDKGFAGAHTSLGDAEASYAVLKELLKTDTELVYEPPSTKKRSVVSSTTNLKKRTEELFTELDATLSLAQDNPEKLSEWEHGFIDDFTDKRERYGDDTYVSEKQATILRRIRDNIEGS